MYISIKQLLPAILLFLFCLPHVSNAQNTFKNNALEIIFSNSYSPIYADHGTGADMDLSTWRPITNPGFYSLGHMAKQGYSKPTSEMVLVKPIDPDALRHPIDYRRIYIDSGTGGDQDASFWEPIPPAGYVALGMVVMNSYSKPSLSEVVCVRNDLVAPAEIGDLIWHDRGSGGDMDVSLWQIKVGMNSEMIVPNTFFAHANYSKPRSAPICYGLKLY
ncbi:MAG: Vps62-related protein [Bacteroidia bacterium]|nr:Vps62-related protein [Bacteroidia bacterium]